MRPIFLGLAILAGCVKGNPIDTKFLGNGGSMAIDGCGYSVTTQMGAEAPIASQDLFGADPTPRLVHLGVIGDPKTSVVVQWRTADEVTRASTIRWAQGANLTADQLTQTTSGIHFAYTGTACAVGGPTCPYRQHQAHLCGLQPGTTYSYQVGGHDPETGADHFSPVYTFHTAPDLTADPAASIVAGFVGDCRGGYDVWQQFVNQYTTMSLNTPDVILFSGDAVTVGITQPEWEEFLGEGEPLFATTQIIFADGNHEDNAVNFLSQFAQPGDQENFGMDWGYAHITVANDTPEDPSAITGANHDLLAQDLAASANATWKIVMHHQPMWSSSTSHGSNVMLQAAWQPLIDQYHVDLVLNGHDHDFEVTLPIVGMAPTVQPTNATGTVYVVGGGGGAELYPNGSHAWTACSESNYEASVIHISQSKLELDAFHTDGTAAPCGFMKTK
ncbi:MAG TPA: metallophosphoesterase family protein [Kofleriaceae bacterium]|nr:metallophosphoesterase family protein [Kofleriaceae bacterium]